VWNNLPVQKLLYIISGLIVLLIIIGLALPQKIRVVASIEVDAPLATVFAQVNDFQRASLWSPWLETDPNARIVYSGPDRGVGAMISWDGVVVGIGTQIITDSNPFTHIATTINPGGPGEAKLWFDFVDLGKSTYLDWTFEADYGYNIVGRYAALLLKDIIRRDYEHGLGSLKDIAESLPRTDFSDLEIERLAVDAEPIAYLPTTSSPDATSLSEAMGEAYFRILSFIEKQGLTAAGAPLSITRSLSGSSLLFDAAIPVQGLTDATPRDGVGVKIGNSHAGTVLRVKHLGSYRSLGLTHQKIAAYLAALGIERDGVAWESYVSDPTKVSEAEILTYVYYPIRP
jgi:effector-binding domain-containing protein